MHGATTQKTAIFKVSAPPLDELGNENIIRGRNFNWYSKLRRLV
jgi:hypothetical protein